MINPFNMKAESETFILRHREGILKQLEPRVAGLRFIIYRDHVEAPLARKCHVPQVITGYGGQGTLLFPVHGRFGRFDVVGGAGLDLNEAQHIFIPTNQVNLSPGMRRTKVSRHHHVSAATQVEIGVVLATSAGTLVLRPMVGRKHMLGEPVKGSDGGVSKTAGGHT